MNEIIFKEESYKIIGACYEVYNQQGFGFTEPVYQECLEIEFEIQKIPFVVQQEIHLYYKNRILDQYFKPDFICYDKIIVEIKSVSGLSDAHISQTLNYLNATKFDLALLVNFGEYPKLIYKRIATRKIENNSAKNEIESWFKGSSAHE